MKKNILFIVLLSLFFIQCSDEPLTIDGTDIDTYKETVDEMANSLSFSEKKKFQEALDIILLYETDDAKEDSKRYSQMRRLLDKKTADDIFTYAEEIASDNGFKWNRKDTPMIGGVPKPNGDASDSLSKNNVNFASMKIDVSATKANINIIPSFFDATGKRSIENAAVNAKILVSSGGKNIYSYRTEVFNNAISPIQLAYNHLSKENVSDNQVTVSMLVATKDSYLKDEATISLPEGWSKTEKKELTPEEQAEIESNTIALVQAFLQNLGAGKFRNAHLLQKNPNWGSYERFSSKDSFGGITDIEIYDVNFVGAENNQAIIETRYFAEDPTNGNGTYDQRFTLSFINGKWYIIKVKTINIEKEASAEVG